MVKKTKEGMSDAAGRHLLATACFLVAYFVMGMIWHAWKSSGADWLPGWDSIFPGMIAGAIFYLVLRPPSDGAR